MIKLRKRCSRYCADLFVDNQRIRGPLGVRRLSEAERLVKLLEEAISEGPSSAIWDELHGRVPADTLHRFSEFVGVTAQHVPTWDDLVAAFRNETGQRIALGAMAASTSQRYGVTIREFGEFLNAAGISELRQIDKPLVERFKVWRVARIKAKKFARGATGLILDAAILHRIFNFAVANDMVVKNPVRMEGRPGENPTGGAEPFLAEQLGKMRASASTDLLTLLLLRWTGFRGSDAVNITWGEIYLDRKEIERVTQKRKKKVILPITTELLFALEAEFHRRKPAPTQVVLVNPATGERLTRPGPLSTDDGARKAGWSSPLSPASVQGHPRGRYVVSRGEPLRCGEDAGRHDRDRRAALHSICQRTAGTCPEYS